MILKIKDDDEMMMIWYNRRVAAIIPRLLRSDRRELTDAQKYAFVAKPYYGSGSGHNIIGA